ncbi:hypothetical protein [Nocardioides albus]|uniref:Uncharacterized protein n=1 Tax=Nocardioides albus TaxID=1841 RepID=A0A7W5A5L9_9ACTN|nr:hypothetical protein [Nocardioides albus]MBB3089899.1 hypothetical protein [Nocardioides albus]
MRLKLYLSMCLVATKAPYRIEQPIPARVWASMLALPDPELNGARRVSDALTWLHKKDYVRLVRSGGAPPEVRLRSASGNGAKFVRPLTNYVQVPLGLWKNQWIARLSGRSLAVLLALLDLQGGKDPASPPSMNTQQRNRYGFSQDTWTRGERELKNLDLLTVRRSPQGAEFDWRRMRNTYWVDVEALNSRTAPLHDPSGADSHGSGRGHTSPEQ